MPIPRAVCLLFLLFLLCDTPCLAEQLNLGSGEFSFVDPEGNPDRPIRVFYYCPRRINRDSSVVFVIHGKNRNADGYRDTWIKYAEQKNFLVLCPQFSREHYPNSRHFNLGYMFSSKGELRDKKKWSFYAIERIFDQVVNDNRLKAKQYSIYGHSGGGQFVHRMVLFLPEARFNLAIAANPGWYTMPQLDIAHPYGLKNTEANSDQLKEAFGQRFGLLLGEADTDPNHESLRKTPEAMQQGPHRLARGQEYFRQSRELAKELRTKFQWQIATVPGAGHSNSKMSSAAARFIR